MVDSLSAEQLLLGIQLELDTDRFLLDVARDPDDQRLMELRDFTRLPESTIPFGVVTNDLTVVHSEHPDKGTVMVSARLLMLSGTLMLLVLTKVRFSRLTLPLYLVRQELDLDWGAENPSRPGDRRFSTSDTVTENFCLAFLIMLESVASMMCTQCSLKMYRGKMKKETDILDFGDY